MCRKVYPLADGLIVVWGGNVLLGVCSDCGVKEPIVLRPVEDGVEVRPLSNFRPADILVVSSLSQVDSFLPKPALSKFTKFEL